MFTVIQRLVRYSVCRACFASCAPFDRYISVLLEHRQRNTYT